MVGPWLPTPPAFTPNFNPKLHPCSSSATEALGPGHPELKIGRIGGSIQCLRLWNG